MAEQNKETRGFQTEVKQLLHLMIHSLYSNKEIFLRELISNASDACDKLRFEALQDADLYEKDADLKIDVEFDKDARTVTIRDNGIGMSRDEVVENIGTIAKSGTSEFIGKLTGDDKKDSQLIGQFGVGFYSSFIIADKVTLKTRRAGSRDAVQWESDGEGEYTLEDVAKPERGTQVTLHLREDEDEFLDLWRLRGLITKYSDHISFPIRMAKMPTEEEEKEGKTPELEQINKGAPLWARAKSDVKDDEYKEFYKHVSHDFEDPLTWSHNRVEGKLEYNSLLYIPGRAPFDIHDREHMRGLKLYVQRVFIMDDADKLLPHYLRFVRGVIDSNDLPLNVSRELLQSNRVIDSIRGATVKRVLGMLEGLAKNDPEQYQKFWDELGFVLKEGPYEDPANKERVAGLLRFSSTQDDQSEQTVALADYVSRMGADQDKIYYITADSFAAAKNSPHLEIFRKKGIEVLLMGDRIDEWVVGHLTEFDGKQLQSVAKGDLDLDDEASKEERKKAEKESKPLIQRLNKVLGDKTKEIRVTHRLTDSPACLVAEEGGIGGNLERIMKEMGQDVPTMQPILEINPGHPLIQRIDGEQDEDRFGDWAHLVYDQALLAEGGELDDPASFVKRMNQMLVS